MKIFLSWSGAHSRAIAEALNEWLRRVIQAVKPFYSPEIEKGAKWSNEVDEALEGTRFGIICLTPENVRSPWINYEAGALSKTKDALIWTFLYGLAPSDVPPPLGKFQHTVAQKADVLLLLKTINRRLIDVGSEPIEERLLEENFELFWPKLEAKLKEAEALSQPDTSLQRGGTEKDVRDERAVLDEILELVRSQERRMTDFEARLTNTPPVEAYSGLNPKTHAKGRPVRYKGVTILISTDGASDIDRIKDKVSSYLPRLTPASSEIRMTPVEKGLYIDIEFEKLVTLEFVEAVRINLRDELMLPVKVTDVHL